jgi:hypothetical protein
MSKIRNQILGERLQHSESNTKSNHTNAVFASRPRPYQFHSTAWYNRGRALTVMPIFPTSPRILLRRQRTPQTSIFLLVVQRFSEPTLLKSPATATGSGYEARLGTRHQAVPCALMLSLPAAITRAADIPDRQWKVPSTYRVSSIYEYSTSISIFRLRCHLGAVLTNPE